MRRTFQRHGLGMLDRLPANTYRLAHEGSLSCPQERKTQSNDRPPACLSWTARRADSREPLIHHGFLSGFPFLSHCIPIHISMGSHPYLREIARTNPGVARRKPRVYTCRLLSHAYPCLNSYMSILTSWWAGMGASLPPKNSVPLPPSLLTVAE